ncbi:zinc finger protein 668-like [Ornithodoros turicata]|uniref:zinc finger protein 668-like n=1 Tax=Ornithodoros turicata TaxID=34597 RepID=UPI003139FD04
MSSCTESPDVPFKCRVSNEVFTEEVKLHLRKHEGSTSAETPRRPFSCPDCPREFNSQGALNKHALAHAGQRPHTCPRCPLRFSQKGTLNRHLVTHLRVLPFECQHCGKRYAQAGSLKLHLFSHTQDNGFTCTICGRGFARKHTLRLHVQGVHRRERPHECATCGKRYARRDDLQVHLNTCGDAEHRGRRPSGRSINLKGMLAELISGNACGTTAAGDVSRAGCRSRGVDPNNDCCDSLATPLSSFRKKLKLQRSILMSDPMETGAQLSEVQFAAAVEKLLLLLVGEAVLRKLGWPNIPTEELLREVTRCCGCVPAEKRDSTLQTLRENCRLLFTSVLEDDVLHGLLGAHRTVDDVVRKILQLKEIW